MNKALDVLDHIFQLWSAGTVAVSFCWYCARRRSLVYMPLVVSVSVSVHALLYIIINAAVLTDNSRVSMSALWVEKHVFNNGCIDPSVICMFIMAIFIIFIRKYFVRNLRVVVMFIREVLPARQMHIDSDLSNSLVTIENAREKRNWLLSEVHLVGSINRVEKYLYVLSIVTGGILLFSSVAGAWTGPVIHSARFYSKVMAVCFFVVYSNTVIAVKRFIRQ